MVGIMRAYSMFVASTALFAGLWFGTPAYAVPIDTIFNTGVDGSGTVLADGTIGDPHYSLIGVPVGSTATIRVITSASGFPIPPYYGDNTTSRWIGPNNDSDVNGPVGTYTYQTTFDMTGFDLDSAIISGYWATDNDGLDIVINGTSLGYTTGFGDFGDLYLHSFSIPEAELLAGINTLDFLLNNGGGPTALRVEFSEATADLINGTVPVPEPASLALFGAGLAGLVWLRRRRKATA